MPLDILPHNFFYVCRLDLRPPFLIKLDAQLGQLQFLNLQGLDERGMVVDVVCLDVSLRLEHGVQLHLGAVVELVVVHAAEVVVDDGAEEAGGVEQVEQVRREVEVGVDLRAHQVGLAPRKPEVVDQFVEHHAVLQLGRFLVRRQDLRDDVIFESLCY